MLHYVPSTILRHAIACIHACMHMATLQVIQLQVSASQFKSGHEIPTGSLDKWFADLSSSSFGSLVVFFDATDGSMLTGKGCDNTNTLKIPLFLWQKEDAPPGQSQDFFGLMEPVLYSFSTLFQKQYLKSGLLLPHSSPRVRNSTQLMHFRSSFKLIVKMKWIFEFLSKQDLHHTSQA